MNRMQWACLLQQVSEQSAAAIAGGRDDRKVKGPDEVDRRREGGERRVHRELLKRERELSDQFDKFKQTFETEMKRRADEMIAEYKEQAAKAQGKLEALSRTQAKREQRLSEMAAVYDEQHGGIEAQAGGARGLRRPGSDRLRLPRSVC